MPDKNTYFNDEEDVIEQGTRARRHEGMPALRPPRSRLALLAGLLCIAAGTCTSFATFEFWSIEADFLATSVTADAVMTGLKKNEGNKSTQRTGSRLPTYHVVFEFTTTLGERVRAVDNVARSEQLFSIGDHMQISYDPREPQRAQISAFSERWGFTCGIGLFALVFLLVGFSLVTVRKTKGE